MSIANWIAFLVSTGAGRMLVVERWRNQAALMNQLEAPETAASVGRWAGRMTGDILKYDATYERPLLG
jgi:quinol monooxygenase YgiN